MNEQLELFSKGNKNDGGKPRWYLLPWKQVEDVVKVLTAGAVTYGDFNWQHVKSGRERYFSACVRHLTAWVNGEPLDPEDKLPHLAHAVCCVLFLMWLDDNS